MTSAIDVAGLTKTFGHVLALSDIDLRVEPGEVHGLLGPNGAGKSTLLRVLFGLVRPDEGRVALFGREHRIDGSVDTLVDVAGFVDRPHFYPYLTARRTLEYLAVADGRKSVAPIEEVLSDVGLADVANRRVAGWSTGMLQRLGLACALLRRPRLLLLDEPTEGLDPIGARELLATVRARALDGVTVLLSTHDMAEVDEVCDRATILHRGAVLRSASISELRESARRGRHRLSTSDDETALAIGARHPVVVERRARGGLSLEAGPREMHNFVCEPGQRNVSVVRLEEEVAPLTALFYQLMEAEVPQAVVI
jgi:ABC-2 type transport system ATP-binding protein